MRKDEFAAINRLLIDGNNLLHRRSGGADSSALRALLPRLQAVIPAHITTIVMLDGHAAPGSGRVQRIRAGLEIRQSGSLSADEALLYLIRDNPRGTTLVSDDRALRDKAMHLGAHTVRLDWLEELLAPGVARPPAGAVGLGNRRPPGPRPPGRR